MSPLETTHHHISTMWVFAEPQNDGKSAHDISLCLFCSLPVAAYGYVFSVRGTDGDPGSAVEVISETPGLEPLKVGTHEKHVHSVRFQKALLQAWTKTYTKLTDPMPPVACFRLHLSLYL